MTTLLMVEENAPLEFKGVN